MGRVFVSNLGTTKYVECRYRVGQGKDGPSPLTPFIQEALVNRFCRDWTEEDRLLIFCTEEAEKRNWIDGGNFEAGLKSRIEGLNLAVRCRKVPVPEGRDEDEIMAIFMAVMNHLHHGDRVLVDITHSFRSLPLLHAVVLNYAKVLKDIQVLGIYYGAFEILGTPAEVKDIPEHKRVAPVFDLTPYDALLDWARAVDIFHKAGRAEEIEAMVRRRVGPLLGRKKPHDRTALGLSRLGRSLNAMCLDLLTARGPALEQSMGLGSAVHTVEQQDLLPPLTPLLDLLDEKTRRFDAASPEDKCFEAADWCLEHRLIPQAYILLRETVLSGLCRLFGDDPLDETMREGFWNGLLFVLATNKGEADWSGTLAERKDAARRILARHGKNLRELAAKYDSLRSLRNDILHGGWHSESRTAASLLDRLPSVASEIRLAWNRFRGSIETPHHYGPKPATVQAGVERRRALLIFSHEPTAGQLEELEKRWNVCEVREMPPDIKKCWAGIPARSDSIKGHLGPVSEWLEEAARPGDIVVVQGDYGASFLLVDLAFSLGLVPLYATTERVVRERTEADGRVYQERVFKHVIFRRYERYE